MKHKKLITAIIIFALMLSFVPFAFAEEELFEFDLGLPIRLQSLAWRDSESTELNKGRHVVPWSGLTIEILKASKTLIIEVEHEPGEEFEIAIIPGSDEGDNRALNAASVTYDRDDVYDEGFITIDLSANPGWQTITNRGADGFSIVLSGSGWDDVGDIFGILKYSPAEIDSFVLRKFNSDFDDDENIAGFSDQVRADWQDEDKIGMTVNFIPRMVSLNIEVSNAPAGDIIFAVMNRANSWDWTGDRVTYAPDDVYSGGIIKIELTGDDAPPFMEDMRASPDSNFAFVVVYYGSDRDPQTIEDLEIKKMWLELETIEAAPDPDEEPDPDTDEGWDPDPGTDPDPVTTPDPVPAGPTEPTLMLSDDISPWGSIILVSLSIIAVVIFILVLITKRR
ncbi:MAG: hypothetical protein FWD38_08730 [Oscillospiraceae bacterium]|nr:hypothetical protein [Oscillospiraceae bacterium]